MRYSYAALVLATAAISQVCAGPVKHAHHHFHAKKDALEVEAAENVKKDLADVDWATVVYTYSSGQTWGEPTAAAVADTVASTTAAAAVEATTTAPATTTASTDSTADTVASAIDSAVSDVISEITTLITEVDEALLTSLGALVGVNSDSSSEGIWIGTDGDYTLEVENTANETVILVVWGSDGSWINAVQPKVTVTLPVDEKTTISFSTGQSGAISAIYGDTTLVDGQVSNTWAEFTFASEYSTVDISREVNMDGNTMEVVTSSCTTNMTTCVFVCDSGTTCEYDYTLENCAVGSQTGANTDDSNQDGGCTSFDSALTMTLA